ncbi:MAG: ferric reductase-like transmembrane domain-containing protein, partial [Candidatus Accumulibacter sp.]|nr:ferric reductase-like transmembrane domain-containing protein [Accumulibacter sp.]
MKRFLLPFSLLIVLTWAMQQPENILDFSAGFLPLREAYIDLTGALALGWMGFCMMLALRPAHLEHALGGLDKLYRVHKWSGIGAAFLVVAHWLLELSPRTLISWGWIERIVRPPRAPHALDWLLHLGREMGEWATWAMLALGLVSLLRFIPYGWFRKS